MKKFNKLLIPLILLTICIPLIVYAVDNTKIHNIEIDKRGGSGGADKIVASSEVNGKKLYLPERIAVPSKSGASFDGFYNKEGNIKYYDSAGQRVYNNEITTSFKKVYAKWTNGTTIYFVKDEYSCDLAKASGNCNKNAGCFDKIDGQGYNLVMNKRQVSIPTLEKNYTFRGYKGKVKTKVLIDGKITYLK